MNINEITFGMTPQDKEIYFAHQEKRHREEKEKVESEKELMREYRLGLIDDILEQGSIFTREELNKKSLRVLEAIASY